MGNSLIAKHLHFQMGTHWLIKDVSLALELGERVALIGPNGAGKSTLLRLLTGFLPADKGKLLLANQSLEQWSPRDLSRCRAVMMQQVDGLMSWPVEAIVAMGRAPWGAKDERKIVEEVLALTGCSIFSGRLYGSLSGGEQQRVQLARSLAQLWYNGSPQGWLFLDEPTSALDLYHQQQLIRLLKALTIDGKLHVFTVLHDLNLAALWATRVLLLHQGKLVADGSPMQVIQERVIAQWYGAEVEVNLHPANKNPLVFLCP
jgi:iron complex transport system ATP-binding protein